MKWFETSLFDMIECLRAVPLSDSATLHDAGPVICVISPRFHYPL